MLFFGVILRLVHSEIEQTFKAKSSAMVFWSSAGRRNYFKILPLAILR